ncbi:MAG: hypothetical protein J6I96_06775 [Oscillospiraceae bacterium]|nr:hypothetical protein [Oscillospiraceae bacterium]
MTDNEKKLELSPDMLDEVNGGLLIRHLDVPEDDTDNSEEVTDTVTSEKQGVLVRNYSTYKKLGNKVRKL